MLHIAAERGDLPLLQLLLQTDALAIDQQKRNGATALHCAAAHGHLQAARALLGAGASMDVADGNEETSLLFAPLVTIAESPPGICQDRLGTNIGKGG